MGLVGEMVAKLAYKPRLADPGLAREQHHLAFAIAHLPPAAQQQRDLLIAADERRQPRGLTCLEAPLGPALAHHPPDRERLGEALEAPAPNVLELKQTAD